MDSLQGKAYIGVDVGSSSARACVINGQDGALLALASYGITTWQTRPGFHTQSTTEIWSSISKAVREAISQANVALNLIGGIAFTATCSLAVFTHDTNEPVSMSFSGEEKDDQNVIFWMDRRSDVETEVINAHPDPLLKYMGGSMSVEMALPKVVWLRDHLPKAMFERCKFYDLSDALDFLATGVTKRTCSAACESGSTSIGLDGTVKGWQEDFLRGVGVHQLAANNYKQVGGVCKHGRYSQPGSHAGYLNDLAAKNLGMESGTPVAIGCIDAFAGWLGTAGADAHLPPGYDNLPMENRVAAVAGTSTCFLAMSKKNPFVNGVWGPYEDWLIPGVSMYEGGQPATGHLLHHIIKIHPAYEEAAANARAEDLSIFDYLNWKLEDTRVEIEAPNIPYLGRYYFMYGDYFGNRSPIGDAGMSGSVIGITGDTSVDNLAICYYGALEFLALQTRQIVEKFKEAGSDLHAIFFSGSQCRNELLLKLIAWTTDLTVVLPRYPDAAVCCGAAILAAQANLDLKGQTQGLWRTMTHLTKADKIMVPEANASVEALLKVKYRVFWKQCEKQRSYRDQVDAVTESSPRFAEQPTPGSHWAASLVGMAPSDTRAFH